MKAPVSACLIVKNEIGQLEACLQSLRPHVEEIVIIDTGSNDGTPEIAKKYADIFEVFTGCNDSEGRISSFSVARQHSFDLATQPWTMWVDGDDEVIGAEKLLDVIKRYDSLRGDHPALVLFPYAYSHDAQGNVTCLHYRERLMAPKGMGHWLGPVHEVYVPNDASNAVQFQTDDVKIVHKRDGSKKAFEQGRNLRILKAHYEKVGETDVRQLYYLGLEYGNVGDLGNAIKFHKRYIELSGWDDERFLAGLKVAEHYQTMGDYDNAVEWALKILTIREGWSEAYFSLAKSYYFLAQRGGLGERRNWEKCIHFSKLGLSLPETKTILFVNPAERTYDIHRYLNLALSKVGDVQGALISAEAGLQANPNDDGFLLNRRIYKAFIARAQINTNLKELVENAEITRDVERFIQEVLDKKVKVTAVPVDKTIDDVPSFPLPELPASIPSPTPSLITSLERSNVVVYVGHAFEPWNPETARRHGIGGSETAIIEMFKRLVKLGHPVTVFGNCENMEGVFDGVRYLHHGKFQNRSCDVLITSRRPDVVDDVHNVKRKLSLCWVHDVHCGGALTHDRALRTDKFLVLSQWHKQNMLNTYKFVHPNQIVVTRNGIDLERFNKDVKRDPHRAVYSSSPDRGMEVAICIWPRVRERVPGAELHIFYGFQTWEASADDAHRLLIARLKKMIHDYETAGVIFHGRVSQDVLAEEYLKSGVWSYPTWFSETSCISAMEAHAAGLRMVTSPIAALNETVADRGSMIPGDWLSLDYQNRFIDAVAIAMTKTDDSDRVALQQYARDHFSWDALASEWSKMFDDLMIEAANNIIPPFKGWM
jgi:glycosyltransferase involved in cell wall biosynthesis